MLSKELAIHYTKELRKAVAHSSNEEQFKINAESILKIICEEQKIFWDSYSYERTFSSEKRKRRVDAIHGSTIIEYERPRSFNRGENERLRHACAQAEEYAHFLSLEEGRDLRRYSMVAWDGETISFGHFAEEHFEWEPARKFDDLCLTRLVAQIADGGRPLVSPMLLRHFIGPQTEIGKLLLPALFNAVCCAQKPGQTTKTQLIYTEWNRLFGRTYSVAPGFDFLGGMAQEKILFFATVGFETSRLCFWSVQF